MRPQPPSAIAANEAMSAHFGSRMKYWRRSRGHTQVQLARDLGVDGSYISKLESSRRQPTTEIAQRCDELLDTGGELAGLLTLMEGDDATPPQSAATVPLVWTAPPHKPPRDAGTARPQVGAHSALSLSHLLDAYVEIDCTMGGSHIATAVERQTQELVGLQVGSRQPISTTLLELAAKFARLAGWLRYDSGDSNGALFWYDCGQRWAQAAAETGIAAELRARCAIIHARGGDHAGALAVARSIESMAPHHPIVAIWTRLAVARITAMTGDAATTLDHLDEAATLLNGDSGELAAPPAHLNNEYLFGSLAASCHLDLSTGEVSHAAEAVRLLRASIGSLPAHHVRELIHIRLRLTRALRHLGNFTEAAVELTKVESMAPRCTSSRLHGVLDAQRAALRSRS